MRKFYFLLISVLFYSALSAQNVEVSTGGSATNYTTLKAAFDAVNAGTHTGSILIEIASNTTETAPAVLNSSGAGSASYTSVTIRPRVDGVTISGATTTGRGVIELNGADNVTLNGDNPNTSGTNQNLTISNTATATTTYTSVVRIATNTTQVPSANDNTISNCILLGSATGRNLSTASSTTGSENTTFGIYVGGYGATTPTGSPVAIASVSTNTTTGSCTANNTTISNNSINQAGRGIVFNGSSTSFSTGLTITNNTIGSSTALTGATPYTSPATSVYTKGIWVAGTAATTISGNTIRSIVSYVATTTNGIELNSAIGTGGVTISNNTITGVACNTTSSAYGIQVLSSASNPVISTNTISGIQANGASGTGTIVGIALSHTGTAATISSNKITDVKQRTSSGYPALGINIVAGNAIAIHNNFISDINAALNNSGSLTTQYGVFGIRITSGLNHKVYHNSVHLSGAFLSGTTPSGASSAALVITANTLTGIDVRNNIFSNALTGAPSGSTVTSIMLPTATSAMNLTLNNNAYYEGSGTGAGIAQVGTTAGSGLYLAANFSSTSSSATTNLRNFTAGLTTAGNNDNSSLAFSTAAPFVSSSDLHLNLGTTPTQLESSGAAVGITADIDDQVRPGPAGSVNGAGFAPDMGADEFDGVFLDITPPAIGYTPLSFTCATGSRTLVATITDLSGVPTSGTGLPVLYWKLNSGSYSAATATHVSGSTYSFSFGAGAALGDVVSYYIVAQDLAPTPNVGALPATGAAGFTTNPPAVSTPPTTPSTYSINGTISGIYTVGAAGTYPTLTAAIADYNSKCLTGPVTFSLIDPLYSTSETFPIVINPNNSANSTNTLTIKPAVGVSPLIAGQTTSTSVMVLNGADYVIVDGSNTVGGTSRDLTIRNINTATNGVVTFWVASQGVGAGATNNVIKNTILEGPATGTSAAINFALYLGSNTGAANGPDNDNITIQNNLFRKAYYGIQGLGSSTAKLEGLQVIGNEFGSTTVSEYLGKVGLLLGEFDGATVSGNTIYNMITTNTNPTGLALSTGSVNSLISGNTIRSIRYTGTGGYGGKGIDINTGNLTSNLTFANNMVSDILGDGWSSLTGDGIVGFRILGTTGGINLYHNTINLGSGTFAGSASGTLSAALYIPSAATGIDIRNNIFSTNLINSSAATAKSYSIYSAAANSAFTAINNNNYSVSGTQGVLGFLGSATTTLTDLQTAFGGNTASKSVSPSFVSATDLHLTNALGDNLCLNGAATPIAAVTTDIDGQTRNSTTPDIGADEFAPTLPTFLVANQAVCFGTNVDLTAASVTTGSTAGQTFTYFTDAACTTALTNPNAVSVSGTYYIKATYGTAGCSLEQVLPVVVTINALPTVSIAVTETSGTTNNDGTTCSGAAATLTASGAVSYSWTPGSATTAAITVNPTATTTYTVTGTDANGCQNSASSTITVNALPTPSITVTDASGAANNDGTICFGGSATLTAAGGTSYAWTPGGATTAAITVSPTATTNFVVTATDANGCSNTSNTTITVTPLPTQFNVTGGGPYCATGVGSAVGLDGSEAGVNYQLVLGGTTNVGAPVSGTGSAISFGLITTAGTYTVVATNATTTCTQNMTGSVTVSILPLPVITTALTEPTTCVSTNGAINLTMSGAAGPYTFNWTGNNTVQGQEDQTGLSVGSYTVVVTAANTCQATSNITLIGPGGCSVCPTITAVTATPSTICQSDNTTLAATGLADMGISYGIEFKYSTTPLANPYVGGTSIAVVNNASLTGSGTGATTTASFPAAGTYYVYAILAPAPVDPTCRPSRLVMITVNPNPTITLGANPVVCSGTTSTSISFTGTNLVAQTNVLTNGSFENNYTGWTLTSTQGGPLASLTLFGILNAGQTLTAGSQLFDYFNNQNEVLFTPGMPVTGAPTNGTKMVAYYAQEPSFSRIYQDITVPLQSPQLSFDFGYLSHINFGPGQTLSVVLRNPATDALLTTLFTTTATSPLSLPIATQTYSLAAYAGQQVRLDVMNADIQNYYCDVYLDNVQVTGLTASSTYSINWGAAAIAQGFTNVTSAPLPSSGPIPMTLPFTAAAGTYSGTITVTNGFGCSSTAQNFTVEIVPTPTVNSVTAQTACNGATVNVPFSGFVAGTVFEWTNSNTAIGLAASGTGNLNFTGTNSGTTPISANITVVPKYTANGITCTGTPVAFTITINPTPTVNTVSNQVVCNTGATTAVSFSGAVTGTVYNWTNSNPAIGLAASGTGNIASFTAINTGTAPVIVTITVTPAYTNGGVTCSGTATTFTITVNPSARVNTVANQTVCNGANTTAVTFGTTNTGGTTTYSWTNSDPSIGLAASGTGDIAAFAGINTGTAPVTATITVTPSYTSGGVTCTGATTSFTVTVNPTPTVNTVSNQVVCNGANTTAVAFSGAVTGTVYNWTNNTPSIGLAASGTGNIAAFAAVNTTNAPITATITVTPSYTNNGVTCTGTSTSFTITVNPTPTVNVVSNQTVCNGGATTAITFSGAVTGTVYNWTNTTTSIGLAASGTGNIASFAGINTGTTPVTATITVTPVFTNGGITCSGTPRTFTITVNPTPTVNVVSNQVVCNGANTAAVAFSGAVTGTVYNWTNNTTSIGLAASGTGNIASFAAVNAGITPVTATITVTPSYTNNGVTCTGTPTTFTITVNPTPTVNTVANQVVCNGSATTAVTFTGAVTGTVYSWTNNTPSIGLAASGTATVPSFTAVNSGVTPIVATITVTPSFTSGGITCTGTPRTFTITVNPTPTVNQPANQVVCNRSNTTAVAFTGAVAGTVYNWTNNTPSIGLAASGTGDIAAFAAVNTTQTPVVATITVTPSYTNGGVTCTGTPRTFTITVNPTPIVVATDLFNRRICISDGAVALNATPVGGSWSGIGVSGFNFIPGSTAVGNYVLTYTYTNQLGCSTSDTTTAKVFACDERNRSLEQGGAILFPNPNGGQFNIRVNSTRFQFLQMRLYNSIGQLVATKQWNGLVFGQVLPIDMRHLAAGMYTVRIIYDGGNLYEDKGYQMLIAR